MSAPDNSFAALALDRIPDLTDQELVKRIGRYTWLTGLRRNRRFAAHARYYLTRLHLEHLARANRAA